MTNEQRTALRAYAECVGEDWKRQLRADWMRGGTEVRDVEYHLLHRLRNTHGPEWLAGYELEPEPTPETEPTPGFDAVGRAIMAEGALEARLTAAKVATIEARKVAAASQALARRSEIEEMSREFRSSLPLQPGEGYAVLAEADALLAKLTETEIPLCALCAQHMTPSGEGNGCGDFPWRPATEDEACGAYDHADIVQAHDETAGWNAGNNDEEPRSPGGDRNFGYALGYGAACAGVPLTQMPLPLPLDEGDDDA